MSQTEVMISGFGGQGILFAGEFLAYAAICAGKQTTWFPSYGPEMRGGTAHCTVVISGEEIGSPLVRNPEAAVVMNLPSLDKYEPAVRSGGILVADSSMVNRGAARTDLRAVFLPATASAEALGSKKVANLVMIGAYLALQKAIPFEVLEQALGNALSERHRHLMQLNLKALKTGAEFAQAVRT